jgi:glutamyl/glutaminyl-tRNA synthetase
MEKNSPIFITGAERSGSGLIARIFSLSGAFLGETNKLYENIELEKKNYRFTFVNSFRCYMPLTKKLKIPVSWHDEVMSEIYSQGYTDDDILVYKDSKLSQIWPVWDYAFPDAKWIIVRRRTPDIINSCVKTAYMRRFKNKKNLNFVQVNTEEEGWLWWIHQYENKFIEMMQQGLNVRIIWPDRMVAGDFRQIKETVEWAGLKWDDKIIPIISELLKTDENGKSSIR